jgi:hypothetical protein
VEEVARNSHAEACWYFPVSREQYRISGQLMIVGADHQDQRLREVRCRWLHGFRALEGA